MNRVPPIPREPEGRQKPQPHREGRGPEVRVAPPLGSLPHVESLASLGVSTLRPMRGIRVRPPRRTGEASDAFVVQFGLDGNGATNATLKMAA